MIRAFQANATDTDIIGGQHAKIRVFLPTNPLSPLEDISIPFKFNRKKNSSRLSFVININKA